MRDGFIAAASAVPKLRLADCRYNAEQTFAAMRAAEQAGARVLVLPELGLTGATCGDLFLQETLLRGAEEALATVLEATRNLELVAAAGLPLRIEGKLYNCAAVTQKGKLLGIVPKSCLAGYGEFYETRWFSPAPEEGTYITLLGQEAVPFAAGQIFRCAELPELVLGFEIGGDLLLPEPPSVRMARSGATLICNLFADSEGVSKAAFRRRMVSAQSARLVCGYACSGAGEGESAADAVYGAHQMIAENGRLLAERRFDGGLLISEIDVRKLSFERRRTRILDPAPEERRDYSGDFSLTVRPTKLTRYIHPAPFVPEGEARDHRCAEILHLAALGLKRRLKTTGSATAVLGLSGGLDSTLAALVSVEAMRMLDRPPSAVLAVTMPGFGTSESTRSSAVRLAERLGLTLRTVEITPAVLGHFRDIGYDPEDHGVTYENAQARERTQILMDLANSVRGLVVGTGDLSELALGWCTYNGDHMSMYAVNASIPKTLIRHIVRYAANECRSRDPELSDVLSEILDTPISPELLPAVQGEISQKTEDLVGPYELHDFFLYYTLRWGFPPRKVFRLAQEAFGRRYSREAVLNWMKIFYRRFFSQQFKRDCVPDGPKVGTAALSPRGDWRMPSDAAAALWLDELETLE